MRGTRSGGKEGTAARGGRSIAAGRTAGNRTTAAKRRETRRPRAEAEQAEPARAGRGEQAQDAGGREHAAERPRLRARPGRLSLPPDRVPRRPTASPASPNIRKWWKGGRAGAPLPRGGRPPNHRAATPPNCPSLPAAVGRASARPPWAVGRASARPQGAIGRASARPLGEGKVKPHDFRSCGVLGSV